MKIYDCFTYFNEDHLIDLRLNILNDFVDYFVICEAKEDHRGKKKELNFPHKKFIKFQKKIIYITFDKFENCQRTWDRQNYQRNYLSKGIIHAEEDDIIMFSDVDEIPNPEKIKYYLEKDSEKIGIFDQKVFYYKLNLKVSDYQQWEGTRICKKKNLKSFSWLRDNVRLKNLKYGFWRINKYKKISKIENGGWHFSFLGNASFISSKIKSYVHNEYDIDKFTSLDEINYRIANHIDPYYRKKKLVKISIDQSYPDYIVLNQDKYKDLIIK